MRLITSQIPLDKLVWQGAMMETLIDPNMDFRYWVSSEDYHEEGLRLCQRFIYN